MSHSNIPSGPLPVSCVVLTGNEEQNIERCLASLHGHSEDIIVVDSFSSDRTLEIVRRFTDRSYSHVYEGHPQQWAWALANVSFAYEWIFAVDADFVVTTQLWAAIRDAITNDNGNGHVNGYFVRHRQVFRGRPLKYGSIYPRYWLRLFKRQHARLDLDDLVDVHFYVDGPVGHLEADVIEDNMKDRDLRFWVEKQARFARSWPRRN